MNLSEDPQLEGLVRGPMNETRRFSDEFQKWGVDGGGDIFFSTSKTCDAAKHGRRLALTNEIK